MPATTHLRWKGSYARQGDLYSVGVESHRRDGRHFRNGGGRGGATELLDGGDVSPAVAHLAADAGVRLSTFKGSCAARR
jgi:hypothetical protein